MVFQIYTANKLVLESQTLNRMLETDGVLPTNMTELINTPSEEKAREFARQRVQRYQREPNAQRLEEIKHRAKSDSECLQLLIFDEAHFGATSNCRKNKKETPYHFLINDFNSDDYPNVIVLLVTATPWNLMTASSKLETSEAIWGNEGTLELPPEGALSAKNNHKKVPIHEIKWNEGQEGDLLKGKKTKLMGLLENLEHHFMHADFTNDCIQTLPNNYSFEQGFQEATVFTIHGSMHGYVTISCKNPDTDQELFWTWPENKNRQTIRLKARENDKYQKFTLMMRYGNDIACFAPYGQDRLSLWIIKHNDEDVGKVRLKKDGRLGGNVSMPQEAPLRRSFLLFPKNSSTKFYLSLNHIVNSMRYTDVDRQRIRHDQTFSQFLKNVKKSKKMTQSDLLTANYCLVLLLRKHLLGLLQDVKDWKDQSLDYIDQAKLALQSRIDQAVDDVLEFIALLNPKLQHNRHHNPISPNAFKNFLNEFYKKFDNCIIIQHIIGKVLNMHSSSIKSEEYEVLSANVDSLEQDLWLPFGASGEIINKCLQKYDPTNDKPNGHMAMIRASNKTKENGNQFKQSLCIAKKIAKIDLEIIQDYGDQTSMALKHHAENAVKDAQQFDNPEHLRIMKKIQCDNCEKVDGKGMRDCLCSRYVPESDQSLTCRNCHHIHKEFKSYSDLKGLPCLLILVKKGQIGDTFPHSLVAIDDRGASVTGEDKEDNLHLTTFTQEKGRLCRYTTLDSTLPFVYVGQGLYNQLLKSLKKDCAYWHSFVFDTKKIDCLVTLSSRGILQPKNRSTDAKKQNKNRYTFILLIGEPQIGKTGVFYNLCARLRRIIEPKFYYDQDFEPDYQDLSEEEGDDEEDEERRLCLETIENLPKLCDSIPKIGYKYPRNAPKIVGKMQRPSETCHWPREKLDNEMITHGTNHFCMSCGFDAHPGDNVEELKIDTDWFSGIIRIHIPDLEQYHDFFANDQKNTKLVTIMTPSFNRIHSARLNWNHLMKNNEGHLEQYFHFVFVRQEEAEEYKSHWGNYVAIVEVPDNMNDVQVDVYQGGVGYVRRFIQRFADCVKINDFYMCDDTIVYFRHLLKNISFYELDQVLNKIGPMEKIGIIGIRKFRRNLVQRKKFQKSHCTTFMKINNRALMERDLLFQPWKTHEDLHLCNEVDQAGLHVLRLNNFQFVKANSCDPLDLYIWNQNQKLGLLQPINDVQQAKIMKVMKYFLKSCLVKNVITFNQDLCSRFLNQWKQHTEGTDLIIANDLNFSLDCDVNSDDLTVIYPMPKDLFNVTFANMRDVIRRKIKCDRSIDEFIIGSTHKPGQVENDYIVLQIRLTERQVRKRSASSIKLIGTPSPEKRYKDAIKGLKRVLRQNGKELVPRLTRLKNNQTLIKKEIESEESEDSGLTSEPENQVLIDDDLFKNYYAISSLKGREIGIEYQAVIVHVISDVFKNYDGTKNCVLVEDIGETQGYHSCLMFWHNESPPKGLDNDLKPGLIYRIENVRTKTPEEELFHHFQLKLSNRSRIWTLPPVPLPFQPKSVLSIFAGFHDFLDIKAKIVEEIRGTCTNEEQPVLHFVLKDELSIEYFHLKSEPSSSLDVEQIKDKCKDVVMKIRSAKVIQRRNDKSPTIFYKNIDSILYYNFK